MSEGNEQLQHQTEGEISASEEYQRARDVMHQLTGGLVIEGTDSPEAMAVSVFQASATSGAIVTLAVRGVRTDEGGTEHSTDVVVEDYTQPVAGGHQ